MKIIREANMARTVSERDLHNAFVALERKYRNSFVTLYLNGSKWDDEPVSIEIGWASTSDHSPEVVTQFMRDLAEAVADSKRFVYNGYTVV